MFNFFPRQATLFDVFDDFPFAFGVPRPPYTNQNFRETVPKPPNLKKQQSEKKSLKEYNQNQSQYWDILGDECLKQGDTKSAIQHYSRAIEIANGTDSSLFRDRGEAFKRNSELHNALQDAIAAIELDDKNIKAYLLCGQVLAEIGKNENSTNNIQKAIIRMTKALTLCAGQKKQYYEAELSKYIYRAKKLLWYKQREMMNLQKHQAIENYKQYVNGQPISEEEKQKQLDQFINSVQSEFKFDIPNYLICKVTLDLMENPVVTEAGHCYEKDVLIEHLEKNGPIDPVTRQPISAKFYPCQNVKQAIENFLVDNPWAFEYSQGESYQDIQF